MASAVSCARASFFIIALAFTFLQITTAVAYDNSLYDNVAVYWGQNSYGGTNGNPSYFQKPMSYYCQDSAIDVIPVAFVNIFFGAGGMPVLNLANTCNPTDNITFSETQLPDCSALAADIEYCQSQGKIVTISLGGWGGDVGFKDDIQARAFAHTIWNLFLGGNSTTRPFGSAVLDGVDLDIEGGSSTGYVAFVTQIRSLAAGAKKYFYITGAPQCPFPDAYLGGVINQVGFDALYVQFYNNYCDLPNYNTISDWDFGAWDLWARQMSPNPNVKIYIGAPASNTAAGRGYVPIETLSSIATTVRQRFPSFGGVMLWDASQAHANNRFDLAIKHALVVAGSSGFTYPICTAPAYVSGKIYTAGVVVSYGGYIWEAVYWTGSVPSGTGNTGWSAISACKGDALTMASSSPMSLPPTHCSSERTFMNEPIGTRTTPRATFSTTGPTAIGMMSCAGVPAWQTRVAYTGGQKVAYNGHLWTAKWWSENDVPRGTAGPWTDEGPCRLS